MVVDPDFSPLCSNHPVNTDILYASPLRHFPSRSVCSSWVILGTRITFPTTVLAVASLNYIQTQTLLLSIRTAGAWHASRLLNNVSLHMHFKFNISDIHLLASSFLFFLD